MTIPSTTTLEKNDLTVIYKPLDKLVPYINNPRTHSKKQIRQIAASIKEFGFTNPVLLDDENGVIAGHGRIQAANLLGIEDVPTIKLSNMTEAQKRAYIIADNKLAENADWDTELLSSELEYINEIDVDFDLEIIGFESAEIDFLLSLDPEKDPETLEAMSKDPPVSKEGDLWICGDHRILCGNALNKTHYETLMGEDKARAVFTDPPYNVPVSGHICGKGNVKHDEFVMASGEMSEAQFTSFLESVFKNLISYSVEGSLHYICMDWRHMREILAAGEQYTELKNLCVWNKTNGGMGSLYRSKHELIFVYKSGAETHVNNIDLGAHGRYRTNVWDYAGVNVISKKSEEELAMHPTVKPVAMIQDAILDSTKKNDVVLDCFGGSGSTLIAAEKANRRARILELDPRYVDTAIKRYQKEFKTEAINARSQKSFNIMSTEFSS